MEYTSLPLLEHRDTRASTEFALYFDYITDTEKTWGEEEVKGLMLEKKFQELTAPVSPAEEAKTSTKYTMSLFILPVAGGG